jgi:hypothetical protein
MIGTGQRQERSVCNSIAKRSSSTCNLEGEFRVIVLQGDCTNSADGRQLLGSFTEALTNPPIAGPQCKLAAEVRVGSEGAQEDEMPSQGSKKRRKGVFTPYAPAVLTLRRPSAAISLG